MNLREVIDALTARAAELPAGLDTEVRVSMCDGVDNEITRSILVDHMAEVSQDDFKIHDLYVIVQGHPHRDEHAQKLHGVMHDADDYLRRWAAEGEPGERD